RKLTLLEFYCLQPTPPHQPHQNVASKGRAGAPVARHGVAMPSREWCASHSLRHGQCRGLTDAPNETRREQPTVVATRDALPRLAQPARRNAGRSLQGVPKFDLDAWRWAFGVALDRTGSDHEGSPPG